MPVDDALWDEFHAVVNMTSRELRDWLATNASGPGSDALPDQAGTDRSRAVLDLLGKRRTDLTADDARVMRSVVDQVHDLRGEEPEPTAGDARWRRRLMSVGHDPLKPTG
ncbi:DUF3140 domain-containing protein [Isoptericola sp. b441]|uniref:DUF3140 domain-containing protein n=1 Tax=Actinotalea lenta TaxID=3064654 RepID=A0ABT9D7B2_9CELL|nr:DUF3140 domain-containing protein [Isoptericola sp. b441]MDO8106726.1 DUF3140 domain-containing protein [Isoptericola sp. b441]